MELKTFLLTLLMVALMGSSAVIEKMSLRGGSPLIVLTMRSCLMTLCFLLVVFVTGAHREFSQLSLKTHLLIFIPVIMGVIFLWLYYAILQKDLASRVFPIVSSAPVITLILSVTLLGEPFSWQRLAGILLVVLGVALIR